MRFKIGVLLVAVFLVSCVSSKPPSELTIRDVVNENNPIKFNGKVTYRNSNAIKPEILSECEIKEHITASIIERSSENGLPISQSTYKRELIVEIIGATPGIFVFGNTGGVPATLDVSFKLIEGDDVIYEQDRHCQTKLAGFLGLQPSACNKLEKCARNQGEYISERLYRKLYK
ncbi:hypothetical protein [Oceanicoccus sp. KOV_DT_Chl]|uniref:hypothetical protein n=1 Tax=Oceanicoccus sp. KOV_DT_Chl TaxID=1904639 RepID=UPI000C7D9190|nr:hypothetical protein [Oceanicoccus sp. KOV_DT_Chl]